MEFIKTVWNDAVGSKVIAALIIAIFSFKVIKKLWHHPKWGKLNALLFGIVIAALCYILFVWPPKMSHIATSQQATNQMPQHGNNFNERTLIENPSTEMMGETIAARYKLFDGSTWTGQTAQIVAPGEAKIDPFQVTFHFVCHSNVITGTSSFTRNGVHYETRLKGGLYNESILDFEYVHLHGVKAFGYIIFELAQVPNKMTGKCVVYGSVTHKVSVGTIELTKVE